jgi:plastocyanin
MGMTQEDGAPGTVEIRLRLPLQIVIPIGSLLFIGLLTFGLSRILLSVPKAGAVIIALAMAANILAGCAFLALRRDVQSSSLLELLMVVCYPLVIGLVIAQVGGIGGATTEEASASAKKPPAGSGPVTDGGTLVAQGVKFSASEIDLPANKPSTITLDNKDTVQHNMAVYQSETQTSKPLFRGDFVSGGSSADYRLPKLKKGTYYFHCDVHPTTMKGDVVVK